MDALDKMLKMVLPVENGFLMMPTAASSQAKLFDDVYIFLVYSCFILFLLVVVPMTLFAIKYRRKSKDQKALSQKDHNLTLEIIWSVLPFFYLLFLFVWGFINFMDLYMAPIDAKELRVTGQKWQWTINYTEEDIEVAGQGAVIGVVIGKPVKLTMASQDVIHSFFIPNFRVKQDVVPGRYSSIWFTPTMLGDFPVFCAEYCGDQHSMMMAKIRVMEQDEYNDWIDKVKSADKGLPLIDLGKKLYAKKGCNACHSVDGKEGIAPTFKGLYGKKEELESGASIVVDDDYIKQSLLFPQKEITKGYPPVMPSFQGQLSERDILALITFIKSFK